MGEDTFSCHGYLPPTSLNLMKNVQFVLPGDLFGDGENRLK